MFWKIILGLVLLVLIPIVSACIGAVFFCLWDSIDELFKKKK